MTGLRAFILSPAAAAEKVSAFPDGGVAWNKAGKIVYAGPWKDRPHSPEVSWKDFSGRIVTPGLIDVHSHLPQYPAVGHGGLELIPWLKRFIFPMEREFPPARAREEAPRFFSELKKNGITSAVIYTTVDAQSTEVCFAAAEESGLRVTMGQMMMDIESYAPGSGKELTRRTLEESAALCEKWHGRCGGRLQYAFSPRFALTCSADLMRGAASLACSAQAFVQTHLAENPTEVAMVAKLFPA